jgi:NADPH:quinone reductase-like Zn-dependent oxidoreductase
VTQEDLLVLAQLAESGQLTPAVDRTFSLVEAPKAIRHLDAGHARGKVVVTV